MHSEPSVSNLFALLIASNPAPSLLGTRDSKFRRNLQKSLSPYLHHDIEASMRQFFNVVPDGERVMFSFTDPNGKYEQVFDGYRVLIELPVYICSKRNILLFPTFYTIETDNLQNQNLPIWGIEVNEIVNNMKCNSCRYSIYISSNKNGLPKTIQESFNILSTFDWELFAPEIHDDPLWKRNFPLPTFYLMSVK